MGTDRYGNAEADWSAAQRTSVSGWLAPRGADEVGGTRETADFMLFLGASADLDSGDRVEIDGRSFEVTGPPTQAWRATVPAQLHHLEAPLRWVEG